MSARSRANKISKRAAHEMAQQHSESGWSAIRAARELVEARDGTATWMVDKDDWKRGYGGGMRDGLRDIEATEYGDGLEMSPLAHFGLMRAHLFDPDLPEDVATDGLLEHVHRLHSDLFTLAEPFIISPEMHQVVSAAADTMDVADLTTLIRDDILIEHGVLWLPRPMPFHDSDLLARALSWTLRPLGDDICLVVTGWQNYPAMKRTPPLVETWSSILMLAGERFEPIQEPVRFGSLDVAAYLFAFLRLSAQRIVITPRLRDPERFPGKAKPHELVRVTRLRAYQAAAVVDADARPIDWQHRWVVKMHKVRQWYPSLGSHRVIFRGPFIKGPDDKPLLTGEKVNALVR